MVGLSFLTGIKRGKIKKICGTKYNTIYHRRIKLWTAT